MTATGPHLGDLISALLDDELEPGHAEQVQRHLGSCPLCAAEYDGVASVRAGVRGLPLLDPPFGLYERILLDDRAARRGPARRRAPVVVAGAAAAVALLVLGLAPRHTDRVRPPVATFVDAHATATPGAEPVSGLAPVAIPVRFSTPSSTPAAP
jgi:anti-sigma factor RsiW